MNKAKLNKLLMEILFPACAFIFCLVLLMVVYSAAGFALFDHKGLTIISFDMQSQYIAYLRYFKTMLESHGSLDVYTLNKVFGGDFLSIYTFYLGSPFNYLVVFVNDADLPLFFIWSTIIKMSLASLGMYLLIRYVSGKYDFAYIGFAVAYGLVSYSFIYSSNFMWIDNVMILPYIIMGLLMIESRKNPVIYVLALAYSFIAGWYIGALVAIFTVLFFLARFIAVKYSYKEKLWYLCRFSVFSLLGGLISMTNWLVAFSHLDGTKASNSVPKFQFFDLSMFFSGMLENGYFNHDNITINSGYMPLFISIAVIALAVMFFFNKGYSLATRLSYLGVVVVYYFASMTTTTNAWMHGGREPTWFPARFAFVISFLFCYLGALEYAKKDETPIWGVLSPLGALAVVLPIVLLIPNHYLKTKDNIYHLSVASLIIFIAVVILMLVDYFFRKKNRQVEIEKYAISLFVAVLTVASAYRGGSNVISVNANEKLYQNYDTYLADNEYGQYFEGLYNEPYRVSTLFNRPGNYNQIDNNPLFYGFDGLSHFSSSSKKDVENYMKKIGFHYNWFFTKYENGSTASINSLLGVKYIYDDESAKYRFSNYFKNNYPFVASPIEGTMITKYENQLALPLGFISNKTNNYYISEGWKSSEHQETYWYDRFEYQNQMFKTFSGLDENIFSSLNIISVTETGLTYSENEFGFRKYTSDNANGIITVTFKYEGTIDDHTNFYFDEKSQSDARYYLDGRSIGESSYWHKGIIGLNITDNDEHTLRINFSKRIENTEIRPGIYKEDINVLEKHLNIIKNGNLRLEKTRNYYSYGLKGTFTSNGENKDLIFTLPIEKGLHVYIDNKEVSTYMKMNIFTAVDISKLANGEHDIKIIYKDNVYLATSIISPLVLVGTLYYCLFFQLDPELYKSIFKKKKESSL